MVMTSTVAVKANYVICTRDLVGMCRLVYKLTTAQGFTVPLFVPGVLSTVSVIRAALAGKLKNAKQDPVSAISFRLFKR